MRIISSVFVFFLAFSASAQFQQVRVEGGEISGTADSSGAIHIFKGIPFAAPPVGDLRWREPQPVKAWQGVKDAAGFSASCMQEVRDDNRNPTGYSEDCLYLNVWSAGPLKAKRSVMFYLYGGGNLT